VPQVLVADLDHPVLDGADRHHLRRVLRLAPGAPLVVTDGAGRRRPCRLGPEGTVVVAGDVVEERPPAPALTVAFALTKGDRPELTVQKLTELGVDRIVPLRTARTVARWEGDRAGHRLARLRRVAREAAMQSERAFLPDVADLTPFVDAVALRGAALAERGGDPPHLASPTLLVGPEGGWSEEELAAADRRIGLGPRLLRSETAAIAAGALLAALRHGSVRCVGGADGLA
jgi:16S rRNA (uracil1498-N3)-methyltransferase